MTIDLYYMPASAPCRSIRMAAAALGIELNLIEIDLLKGQHMTPEYLAINPQHTIPTLVDNGFVLSESRAILAYLADRNGGAGASTIYPTDPQKRAIINQRMYFDMGSVYHNFGAYFYPLIFSSDAVPDQDAYAKTQLTLGYLNGFLQGNTFVAGGEQYTIADMTLYASLSTFVHADGMKLKADEFVNVQRWMEKCEQVLPGIELNTLGVKIFINDFFSRIKKEYLE